MTLMKTANQSEATVSGHKIEMHKSGSGPPLLFLHGGGGFGTFDPTASPLAEKFTVYAPSHPGFFGSERPDWLYTINDLRLGRALCGRLDCRRDGGNGPSQHQGIGLD